jgi:hypothetical protein
MKTRENQGAVKALGDVASFCREKYSRAKDSKQDSYEEEKEEEEEKKKTKK